MKTKETRAMTTTRRQSRPDGASTKTRRVGTCPQCGRAMYVTGGGKLPAWGVTYWSHDFCVTCARKAGAEELQSHHRRKVKSSEPTKARNTDVQNRASLQAFLKARRKRLQGTLPQLPDAVSHEEARSMARGMAYAQAMTGVPMATLDDLTEAAQTFARAAGRSVILDALANYRRTERSQATPEEALGRDAWICATQNPELFDSRPMAPQTADYLTSAAHQTTFTTGEETK